jgi:uncharacterized protein (PEP-CTERM system associated)
MQGQFLKSIVSGRCTVAAAALFLSFSSEATDWKIDSRLDLQETYTDNVNLAPRQSQKNDFITQISPGISIRENGPRFKINADYQMQNIISARENARNLLNTLRNHESYSISDIKVSTFNHLNANANGELLRNSLFIESNAAISQQSISNYGPQAADRLYIQGNNTQVRTFRLSPYLRHSFKSTATSELRYSYSTVSADTPGFATSRTNSIALDLASGSAFRRIGWGLHYNRQQSGYSNNEQDLSTERYSGDLRLILSPRFALTATGGNERYSYAAINDQPNGVFWSAGFAWIPSSRTSLAASFGKRFYGNTAALTASARSRRTVWSVSYNESITTTQDQLQAQYRFTTTPGELDKLFETAYPDPVGRQNLIDYIVGASVPRTTAVLITTPANVFTNRVYLSKTWSASAAATGAKNTLIFNLYNSLITAQTSQTVDIVLLQSQSTATLLDGTRQIGLSGQWNWRVFSRTHMNLSGTYSSASAPASQRKDINQIYKLEFVRQFQPKLSGSLSMTRMSWRSTINNGDVRQNVLSALLSMKF